MLQAWHILLASAGYLGILFAVAYFGDRRADTGRSIVDNPYIYALSIAVYCTAWTFYGSVGRAASTGVGFLPIYIGPTLMAALWWFVLRKIIRICKTYRVTSIADFIASRYGKSTVLGGMITIIAVVGIMPYISLQLKAVATSFNILQSYPAIGTNADIKGSVFSDSAFYVAMLLGAFTILYGTRHIDATERHEGMVVAIAFESVVKLVAFLAVGIFVTFGIFSGPADLITKAASVPDIEFLMSFNALPGGYSSWLGLTFLSMMAIMFLPRQFQVSVVENVNEDHLRKAMWLFPLYLFAINIFVLPIALGGLLHFPDGSVDPDTFVLTLPLAEGKTALALFVYIGGLSAATGMVIVATIALATMVSNDLVMPVLIRIKRLRLQEFDDLTWLILLIRRGSIIGILLLSYLYFRLIGESYALVSIGLVSFTAAAQFAPAILIGLYWKGASRLGAMAGLCGGFAVWIYTLMLPSFARSGWLDPGFIEYGPMAIELLRPYRFLGLDGLDATTHALIWSMLVNTGLLVVVSLYSRQETLEKIQATMFVDVFRRGEQRSENHFMRGQASIGELAALMARFMGQTRADAAMSSYFKVARQGLDPERQADAGLIAFTERHLSGAIGSASARVMVSSVVQGEALSIEGVMEILDETSQVIEYSHRLEQKSQELERARNQLQLANERLQELDQLKDEFVSTVSHELRTPLTSIRAFSEILIDNPKMEIEKRGEFLGIVVKESERLTRLINGVLDLSKLESGEMELQLLDVDMVQVVDNAASSTSQLFKESKVELICDSGDRAVFVKGDFDQLMQLLINLLGNAVKFSDPRKGRVEITLSTSNAAVLVKVKDNGPGIEADEKARIFDKFHQVSKEKAGKPMGTGLGLAICKRVVELHWGRIWVESEPGQGASFTFELPLSGGDHCDLGSAAKTV